MSEQKTKGGLKVFLRSGMAIMIISPLALSFPAQSGGESADEFSEVFFELKYTAKSDRTLCEAYLTNLNIIAPSQYIVLERPIAPGVEGLSKPDWQELDPLENMDIVRRLYNFSGGFLRAQWSKGGGYQRQLAMLYPKTPTVEAFRAAGRNPPDVGSIWKTAREQVLEEGWQREGKSRAMGRIESGNYRLQVAEINVDHHPSPDTVYRQGSRRIQPSVDQSPDLAQTETDNADEAVDLATRKRNRSWNWSFKFFHSPDTPDTPGRRNWQRGVIDLFLYKGTAYTGDWNFGPYGQAGAELVVTSPGGLPEICRYKLIRPLPTAPLKE
jgi:hypothetical protein